MQFAHVKLTMHINRHRDAYFATWCKIGDMSCMHGWESGDESVIHVHTDTAWGRSAGVCVLRHGVTIYSRDKHAGKDGGTQPSGTSLQPARLPGDVAQPRESEGGGSIPSQLAPGPGPRPGREGARGRYEPGTRPHEGAPAPHHLHAQMQGTCTGWDSQWAGWCR